jgi:Domain of unknown function (DUF397)
MFPWGRLEWRKSSFSGSDGNQECVEVAAGPDRRVRIRESDAPGVVAATAPAAWGAFVRAVRAGEFDGLG